MFVVINKWSFQHIIDTKLFMNYFTFFKIYTNSWYAWPMVDKAIQSAIEENSGHRLGLLTFFPNSCGYGDLMGHLEFSCHS